MSAEIASATSSDAGTRRSPWALSAIASIPARRSATCSPSPTGRRAGRARPRPRERGRARRSCRRRSRGRSRRAAPRGCRRRSPSRSRTGGCGSWTPGWEITIASSMVVGVRAAPRSARVAPSVPSLPPSVEAKIIVCVAARAAEVVGEREQRRRRRRRSSSRPAPRRSRGRRRSGSSARTRPGMVRTTFSSLTSSPSKLELNDLRRDLAALDLARSARWTRSAIVAVALRAGRSVGRERDDLARQSGPLRSPSNVGVATGACERVGTGSNENMSTTNATSAGRQRGRSSCRHGGN